MVVSISIAQLSLFFSAIGGFAQASPQNIPATGNNGITGGVFGPMGGMPGLGNIGDLLAGLSGNGQTPKSPNQAAPTSTGAVDFASILKILGDVIQGKGDLRDMTPYMGYGKDFQDIRLTPEQEASPGTGPYPAGYVADPSLPGKTIFAPKTLPKVKMPVIVWGEGGCLKTGTMYAPFLTEIASHGYLILANGPPSVGLPKKISDLIPLVTSGQTKVTDMLESVDWVMAGKGAKYGDIDTTKIVAAGQSCGGAEALSASYSNDKIKLTVLVNSGAFTQAKALLQQIKYPVAIFNGGPLDIAYQNVGCLAISKEQKKAYHDLI
jgi:dienelactone hydrolase